MTLTLNIILLLYYMIYKHENTIYTIIKEFITIFFEKKSRNTAHVLL